MTTFVLVHGAWHGPWAWDRVVPLLHAAGARTVVPDLSSDEGTGLDDHVHEVLAAIDTVQDDHLVLVAHSYAGLVVRQAADSRHTAIDHVVLVDGWVGGDGASMFGLAPQGFADAVRAGAKGQSIPAPPPAAFGIVDPDDAQWLAERLRPQPLATFTDSTKLTGNVDKIPGTGICCQPETFPFARFAEAIGYRRLALEGPHNVMLARPKELADILLEVGSFKNGKHEA
ncbi:alpha/beta fold hydrolase [Actinomadura fibrosa]|uniref:Alpha/beta fold hydrolase n=1 Tax=Actinomadura fibrosa TaxID=111802 RepID=A0ABW2Y274_9ACTN|nr:alpha/beta fold hydrolase [Actinomadura fibrosa]